MAMFDQHFQLVLTWFKGELISYWPGLAALTVLAVFSGGIRRAVNDGRLGQAVPHRLLPSVAIWAIVIVPVGWWLWSIWSSHTQEAFFIQITDEDGWMEYLQVLLLGLSLSTSGLLACSLWKRRQHFWALGYLLLALALFWTTGEEISWGQRLLHMHTPKWFELHNVQQETNLHNLGDVDGVMSDLTDRALLLAVFVSAAVWMTGIHRIKRLHAALWLPHPSLIPAFCCMISYGKVLYLDEMLHPEAKEHSTAVSQLQEPREAILYFSVLAFLLIVRLGLRSGPLDPAPEIYDKTSTSRLRPCGPMGPS